LISAAILLAGGGLLHTLVAIRAGSEDFSIIAIGFLTSAYYAGFISGCLGTPFLVKRVGHVRVFAALSSILAAAALTHVLFINVPVWTVLRGLAGFAFAGLYMLIESWINEQAPNESRAQVLSIYRMVDLVAVTAGQFMLTLADTDGFVLFSLVAICICVAIFPISLSTSKAPMAVSETSLNLRKLIRVSPLAVTGAFAVGLSNGSFWGVAPVFVQELGHPVLVVSSFMSIAIFCGALLQFPVGFLSDKVGRRLMLILMSLGSAGAGLFLWQYAPQSQFMLLAGGALYGVFAMQLFGISAALANDFAEPHEFVAISGGLLLIYGIGSIFGPVLAPLAMTKAGPSGLFAFTAIVHILLTVFSLYRRTSFPGAANPSDYVAVPGPRNIALIMRLDPRIILKKKKPARPKNQI